MQKDSMLQQEDFGTIARHLC